MQRLITMKHCSHNLSLLQKKRTATACRLKFLPTGVICCLLILGVILPVAAKNNTSPTATRTIWLDNTDCNDPLTGKGVVIDEIAGTCLLCGNADLEDLTDGDLSNFTVFTAPLSVPGETPVVSIKDVNNDYASGNRVGYVIEPVGGLLSVSVLGGFRIRTYLDNVAQETVTGSALTIQEQGALRRLSFVTTMAYDEVELSLVSTLGVLTSVRVYYAFGEPESGCDYACINAVVPPAYSSSINDPATGIFGLCLFCSIEDEDDVTDNDTTNTANINLPIGVGGNAVIAVKANETIPAHYEAGFAVEQGSGLLDLTLLGAITISTYKAGVFRESVVATASLANVTLLGSTDINLISFKTTLDFDELRIRVNGVSLLVDLDVYYAFVRPDDDNDGFTNCVDRCAGQPDYLDADGDGVPDDCDDPVCMLNAGLDASICPPGTTAQVVAAGPGQTWSALVGNPAAAAINAAGEISGMTAEGVYGFVLTEGSCSDTVYINRFESTLDAACNNPIIGPHVIITDPGDPDCLLCVGASVVIDGVLSGYVSLNTATSISGPTTLIAVRDTMQVYPAGRRAGFVVQSVGGLLDATLLGMMQIRTYLNGTLQETATVSGNVLSAAALIGDGPLQRISFVTGQPFDEIELVATATLNLLTEFRVYYAFEEPENGCPLQDAELCAEALNILNTTHCGQISYARTGLVGLACVDCEINNIGNLLDDDAGSFTTINLTVGAGASGQVAVTTRQTVTAGYTAGFVVSGPVNLLDATVLGGLRVRTFLNGVQQEEKLASGGLLQVQVLSASSGLGQLSFVTNQDFDEVQLRVDGLVSALSEVRVHYAFVRRDTDGDGAPDCADKCCGGDDNEDVNGNGLPNACDSSPGAQDDTATTDEGEEVNVPILANDTFGEDGTDAIEITTTPSHGTVTLDDNGTPADPTDDFAVYQPDPNYYGADTFAYQLCDLNTDCDTAIVVMTVNATKVRLLLKMRLQGALYNSPDTLMRDDLRLENHLPDEEPYTALAPSFIHVNGGGGEVVAEPDSVYADLGANSVVDWVFIELRDSANLALVVATRAALLQRDGDVVDTDGSAPVVFSNSIAGAFAVAIRHRNHLGSMTDAAVVLSATGTTIDFSDVATPLYDDGTNLDGLEQVTIDGRFALWAGNVNANKSVVFAGQNNDKDPIFNQVDQAPGNFFHSQTYIYNGYHRGDVNLDGSAIFAGQNNDVDAIFNNVDGHIRNILGSQTFIIREQLAQE